MNQLIYPPYNQIYHQIFVYKNYLSFEVILLTKLIFTPCNLFIYRNRSIYHNIILIYFIKIFYSIEKYIKIKLIVVYVEGNNLYDFNKK